VLLGWELVAVDPEEGTIEVAFTATEQFTNPAGHIQGGFLAAMLDDTLGPALVATLGDGEWAPTIDLHVQFLPASRARARWGAALAAGGLPGLGGRGGCWWPLVVFYAAAGAGFARQSLRRLWVVVISLHSDLQALMPRRWKRVMWRLCLIWPEIGSIVCFRWRYRALPWSLAMACRMKS
jgi:hypothetical protein